MTTSDTTAPFAGRDFDNLSVLGQRDRLHEPGIALCGSRAAGERGIAFARSVGSYAAQAELSLVSGYAKGVDMAGHVACVEAGGHTIAVLAEGLGRFRLRPELRDVIDPWDGELESHLTAVSEFEDRAPWIVWRAMQRNALICSLGKVLVAIDPGETGGTFDAVKKAVKREMPVIIGWSDVDADRDHLAKLELSGVSIVESESELLKALQDALNRREDATKPPEQLQMPLPAASD